MLWAPWEQPPGCADRKSEDAKKPGQKDRARGFLALPKVRKRLISIPALLSRLQAKEKALKRPSPLEPWAQPEGTVFLFFVFCLL